MSVTTERTVRNANGLIAGRGALTELVGAATEIAPEGSNVLVVTDDEPRCEEVCALLSRKFRMTRIVIRPNTPGTTGGAGAAWRNDNITCDNRTQQYERFVRSDVSDAGSVRGDESEFFSSGRHVMYGASVAEASRIRFDEDVRFVVAAGGMAATDAAKFVAARRGLPLAVVPLAPFGWSILSPICALTARSGRVELYKAAAPTLVVCDYTQVVRRDSDRAAIYGEAVSRLASLFDLRVAELAFGAKGAERVPELTEAVAAALGSDGADEAVEALLAIAVAAAESGLVLHGGEERLTEAACGSAARSGRRPRDHGETVLPLALLYMRAAIAFLALPLGAVAAGDNNVLLDALVTRLRLDPFRAAEALRPLMTADRLGPALYALGEYRGELLKQALGYERALAFSIKRVKRLYNDKGFSYNKYLAELDGRGAFALAAGMSGPPALIDLMWQTGKLSRLLSGSGRDPGPLAGPRLGPMRT